MSHQAIRLLRQQIGLHFDLEDLRLLTFDLGLDWDEIPGQRKSNRIQSLIYTVRHQDRLAELLTLLREERPSAVWPDRASLSQMAATESTAIDREIPDASRPIRPEAYAFANLSQFADKKDVIHPLEEQIATGLLLLSDEERRQCAASRWALDRIVAYLFAEHTGLANSADRVRHVRQEWEKVQARKGQTSLVPLHYAVRSLLTLLADEPALRSEVPGAISLMNQIVAVLVAREDMDQGGRGDRSRGICGKSSPCSGESSISFAARKTK